MCTWLTFEGPVTYVECLNQFSEWCTHTQSIFIIGMVSFTIRQLNFQNLLASVMFCVCMCMYVCIHACMYVHMMVFQ